MDTLHPDSSIYLTTYGMLSKTIMALGDTATNGAFTITSGIDGTIDLGQDTLNHLWAERLVFTSLQGHYGGGYAWVRLSLDVNIVIPFSDAYMKSPEYFANEGRR